jgi:uncharacterized protein (DUF1501 family)
MTPIKRFDTDPQQRRFAPLFRAGQARRYAALDATQRRRQMSEHQLDYETAAIATLWPCSDEYLSFTEIEGRRA